MSRTVAAVSESCSSPKDLVIARSWPRGTTIFSKWPGVLHDAAPLKMRVSVLLRWVSFWRSGRVCCVSRSFLSRLLRRLTLCGRREFHPLSPRLGQSDRYGLLGRARAVLATSNVLNFFPDKLPGLRRRSSSFPFSFARSSQSLFLWHHAPPDRRLSSFLKPYMRHAVQGCTTN